MTRPVRTLVYTICTPTNVASAIGCIQIRSADAEDLDLFLSNARIDAPIGSPVLRDFFGIDRGLAVRWNENTLDLFPHGGPAIMRKIAGELETHGLKRADSAAYPESADEIEQRMLETLARAASPRAIELLLDQPKRWRAHDGGDLADSDVLSRLVTPPLVAAVGPANIGKSTLLNALAGRSVSIVADVPGTTRDHVGALLDLGGLVVRYLDTPGLLPDARGIDRAAIDAADLAVSSADLVLACGDREHPPPAEVCARSGGAVIRVCLRADLGEAGWGPDAVVCAQDGTGLAELAVLIRDCLVPPGSINDERPWRFWNDSDEPGVSSARVP